MTDRLEFLERDKRDHNLNSSSCGFHAPCMIHIPFGTAVRRTNRQAFERIWSFPFQRPMSEKSSPHLGALDGWRSGRVELRHCFARLLFHFTPILDQNPLSSWEIHDTPQGPSPFRPSRGKRLAPSGRLEWAATRLAGVATVVEGRWRGYHLPGGNHLRHSSSHG